ncbi:MAG TPA: gephyrin-like molybdotransferase Glp [Candidatus Polarisedimenticolia bacterium]|nr:gephyrin-like molybdotransferase Glp [Candidatus Polarisedimenticolia bacterium]
MKETSGRMIPVEEALAMILREAVLLPTERIPLREAAGRVLAETIASDDDQPPFRKAMMDGYAVRSADLERIPVELKVVEEVPAGRVPTRCLAAGEAVRIMTGAPMPEGADAVQMVERTEPAEDGRKVRILEGVRPGANVASRGHDLKKGDIILAPGRRLSPSCVGLLASVGCCDVPVRRLPRVALAATGDELVEADRAPRPGQIRNSNGPALAALARRSGALPSEMGIVGDDLSALDRTLEEGLKSDLLILSGGVSMGIHDRVEEALERRGVEIFFRQVAIRPGKPAVFGRKGDCLVFGLPGNPVSSQVIFEVLTAAALRKMQGVHSPEGKHLEAVLEEPVAQRPGRTGYLPGSLSFREGTVRIRPIPTTGSADLLAHSRADALLIVPADRGEIPAGDRVRALVLE